MHSKFNGNWNIKILGPSICYINGANTNLGLTTYEAYPQFCNVENIYLAEGTRNRLCNNCSGNLYVWNSYIISDGYSNNYAQFQSLVSNSGIYKYYLHNSIAWSWTNVLINGYFAKHNNSLPNWLKQ